MSCKRANNGMGYFMGQRVFDGIHSFHKHVDAHLNATDWTTPSVGELTDSSAYLVGVEPKCPVVQTDIRKHFRCQRKNFVLLHIPTPVEV
jgi:hypothetical protein